MPKRIYVGNLPFSASDDEIRDLIGDHGQVQSINVRRGDSSSIAAADLATDQQAAAAISALDGHKFMGATLRASNTRP